MQYYNRPQLRFGFNKNYLTPGNQYLLIANAVAYLLQWAFGDQVIFWFGLHPADIFHKFFIWQFVSYMFLHANFWHIFLNMLMLWLFGGEVEKNWGTKEFIRFYLVCGIGAGFFHLIFQNASVVGASGAVYGVLIAFVMLFPDRLLFFFPFPIPLKAKYWAIILVSISLLMGIFGNDHLAHFAHLGGMLVGFLYIKFGWRLYLGDFLYKRKVKNNFLQRAKKRHHIINLRKDVDSILDKINEVGYENLTEREIEILKKASEILSKSKKDTEN